MAFDNENEMDKMMNKANSADDDRRLTLIDDIKVNDGNLILEMVSSELKKGGTKSHIVYFIKGQDNIGKIDIMRRYSEFYLLREMLFSRYPGIFIPPIPSKKYSGNKEDRFVEERKYFLNQFLK